MMRLWYILTKYWPRKIPTTHEEIEYMKNVFMEHYELENKPEVWATVFAQLGAVPGPKLRKDWGSIVNYAKRLDINKLINDHKMKAILELQQKLEKLAKIESDKAEMESAKNASSHDSQPIMQ